jgi:poly(glycerol-phosphate) alpha-glucosyltransferase
MSAEGIWPSNWVVAIAGWDQDGHQQELEARIAGKSATRNIVFVGPLYGSDKDAAYRNSDAFILPSESEGLPLTVIEAWSYGLPVVMTPECNIPQGFEGKAAIRMEANPGDAVSALKALFSMSDQERIAIGSRGLALVKERFTWSRVAAQMHAVYSWVVNGGDAPDSVIRN